jgi:superfamily II DNA or RNA helicase
MCSGWKVDPVSVQEGAKFAVGSLVQVRGREWVVLPESTSETLVLRPLGGTDDEVTGICVQLEPVEPARFELPDPTYRGDHRSSRMLRDAVRIGFRSSAGPFRSFARIAVEPRPYQLVPLLMALRLDPVRLLIADDVGIGKTIEAGLVLRELLDRGEIRRSAVLCPPHLAEQWQTELREKFHIDAALVLPSTATRLERHLRLGQSLFDVFEHVVVSLDFIKSERRRDEFVRACPEMVIVDEAHTVAASASARSSQHQRHHLVTRLAEDASRHLVLVTATPHSGKEDAFRSLLALLDPAFADLPADLSGPMNERYRRRLAMHLVQRRRGDIRHYMQADTPFPERDDIEATYTLSDSYRNLFARVLRYARETVADPDAGNQLRQRVRWWSVLALLRALASSPAAAAATLRTRAAGVDTDDPAEADALGRRQVLDEVTDETAEGTDVAPGSELGELAPDSTSHAARLRELARAADALKGADDAKLQRSISMLRDMLADGYQPIVFCRFIQTAEYVAEALRTKLPKTVAVEAVTGNVPHEERESRVLELAGHSQRILVATDCLSEGINLQAHFNAVLHYDLSWNPTRHEQREGRIDRYGQPRKTVRVITYYGVDNQVDGLVLDVLINKHRMIRSSLGVSVPVPASSDQVLEAIMEGLVLRGSARSGGATGQALLPGFEEALLPQREEFFREWDLAADRERRSRTMFAQESIKVEEVARELAEVRAAIGSNLDLRSFTIAAAEANRGTVQANGVVRFDLHEAPQALRDLTGVQRDIVGRFELPVGDGEVYFNRTHPFIEGLATYVMDTALDPIHTISDERTLPARRCGVIRSSAVERRTTLLLLRYRYHIIARRSDGEYPMLAEETSVVAFAGAPERATWIEQEQAEQLLRASASGNVQPDQARHFLQGILAQFDALWPHLEDSARKHAEAVLEAHRRVRTAARIKGVSYRVVPQLPPDVLGVYVYLPSGPG